MNNQTLKYRGYEGSIEASVEDECFHGRILFIQDRIIYEGNTLPELTECFREAVDDYLETCKKLNKEPNKPFSGQFQIRISPDKHRDAVRTAYRLGLSLNKFVEEAIENKLEKQNTIHHVHEHKHTMVVSREQAVPFDIVTEENQWAQSFPAKTSD
jgi:predicted HicB family RNase H-like nuclease